MFLLVLQRSKTCIFGRYAFVLFCACFVVALLLVFLLLSWDFVCCRYTDDVCRARIRSDRTCDMAQVSRRDTPRPVPYPGQRVNCAVREYSPVQPLAKHAHTQICVFVFAWGSVLCWSHDTALVTYDRMLVPVRQIALDFGKICAAKALSLSVRSHTQPRMSRYVHID